jgi:type III pantothenate kinase
MQAGILLGAIDAMVGMVKRIQGELQKRGSKKAIVIATGGFSELVSKQTRVIQYIEPYLVLEGVRLICEKVKRRGK